MRVLRGHEPGVELWSCAIKWHAIGTMRSGYVAGVIGSDSRVAREVLAIMVIGSAVAAAATTARTDLRSLVDLRNTTPYRSITWPLCQGNNHATGIMVQPLQHLNAQFLA